MGSKESSNLSPSPGTGQDSGVAPEMTEKKEHLQALPTAAARSSQRSAAALFAQVTVTQHSLCLAMPQELQQTQPSPAQARPTCLLCFWVLPSLSGLCSPARSNTSPVPASGATERNSGIHPSLSVPVIHVCIRERRCSAVCQPQSLARSGVTAAGPGLSCSHSQMRHLSLEGGKRPTKH